MEIQEGRIKFQFANNQTPIKFDDTDLYREFQNGIIEGKGVDFITKSGTQLVFIEVKDFRGAETEPVSKQRIQCRLRKGTEKGGSIIQEDSLDIEITQKVAHTFACLFGATTFPNHIAKADELKPYVPLNSDYSIEIILFLEGDFGSATRTKKQIMKRLQDEIKKKLEGWLSIPKIRVVDSTSCPSHIFQVVLESQ